MSAIDPSCSTSNYGINSTYDYRGALLIESVPIDYITQGDGKFDIFHTIKEVTHKKITARVDVTARAWTGE